ncbi:hypothetical protein [Cryobacterium sp. SO1]|nr:hypothetical protein [Cryobacterium sp. SO1]
MLLRQFASPLIGILLIVTIVTLVQRHHTVGRGRRRVLR